MEINRNHSEVSEQQEVKGASLGEVERNPEKEAQRGKELAAQQDMKKPSEREEQSEKKETEAKDSKEEKREKSIESNQDLYAETSKGGGEKAPDTKENVSEKMKLEDLSWNDIHQMQKEDPEKLQAINKDYQERYSAEALGMNVEEYRAHLDRIAEANAPEENKEETSNVDWRSQMEEDLFQNQDLNFEEDQVEEKKDSVSTMEGAKIEPESLTSMEGESHSEKEVIGTQETRDEHRYADLNETQDLFKENHGADEHSEVEESTSYKIEVGSKEEQLGQNEESLQAHNEKSEGSQTDVKAGETESSLSNVEDKKIEQESQTSMESEAHSEKEDKISKEKLEHSESDYESPKSQEINQGDTNPIDSEEVSEEKKEISRYSSEVQEKIERYSSKSFTKESSFDATVYNKDEICKNNYMLSEKDGEKMLLKEQKQEIKDLRESVSHPTEDTVMQKIISEEQINRYTEPDQDKIGEYGGLFGGCISKAEDAAPFTKTPKEAYDNLRLDYDENNPYQQGEVPIYAVRFNVGRDELNKLSIPYGNEFSEEAKNYSLDKPMTGSGFTGSGEVLIPEYMTTSNRDDKSKSNITPTDGMIFKIYKDENGNPVEEPYAWYDRKEKCFIVLNEEDE